MKGRKPIPTGLKILRGNPGKRPLDASEPRPKVGVPDSLPDLTPAAMEHFKTLIELLSAVRLLTVNDGVALSVLAQSVADWREATRELARMGKVIITERGAVKNPWTTIQKQAFDQMQKGFADFGLTPSARARLQAEPESPDANPFASLA